MQRNFARAWFQLGGNIVQGGIAFFLEGANVSTRLLARPYFSFGPDEKTLPQRQLFVTWHRNEKGNPILGGGFWLGIV